MQGLTDEGQKIVDDVAQRHGVGSDAVMTLLMALMAGHGTQAQFNHPDLGGMGQWSQGGMTMVGDMFNQGLKYLVDNLCTELAGRLRSTPLFSQPAPATQSQSQSGNGSSGVSLFVPGAFASRWPPELGNPSSTGSQNDLHYALFPAARRLAIERAGQITVYDIGDHQIGGFSQQQGGDQSLTFTSQYGVVRVADLPVIGGAAPSPIATPAAAAPEPASAAPTASPPAAALADDDIFAKIERLAELHKKDILTAEEFTAKKTELLARL